MITVYNSSEINFNHNGLGAITPSSCYITGELNGAYYLELEHIKDKQGKYLRLAGWNIIKADGQLFRIPAVLKSQENSIRVKLRAEHIFYDLLNDFNEDTRAENKTVEEALRIAVTNPKFNISASNLINTNTAYFIRENPVTSIFQKILPRWGGELYRDNLNIAVKTRLGKDTGILISYGKNIKGFEQTLDYSTIVTRMMPVGKDGLTIDIVNGGSKYLESPRINNYPFMVTKEIKFEDIEDAGELKAKAESLWGTVDIPSANYKINFIDLVKTEEYKDLKVLQELHLGDTVIVRHKIFNVDISARIIKIKKNILTGRLEEIELGQFRENLYNYINNLDGKLKTTQETIFEVNEDLQGTKTIVFQNQEQISLKAQELQKNIDETNEDVSSIDTRLKEAEFKITPDAIVATVTKSTEYTSNITDINNAIETVEKNVTYKVEIISTNGMVFKNGDISTTLIARVYQGSKDLTDTINASKFRWTRKSSDSVRDEAWNTSHFGGTKQITITQDDVNVRATFNCEILE